MPPTKKRGKAASDSGSASDSDSGPEQEEKKPVAKKTKSSGPRVEDADEPTWQLDKMRFVKVREFKGRTFVDIREFYEKDGELKPGKKGISLSAGQFQKLKDIIPEIADALKDI